MRGEGLLYGLAFLGILGVGAALIGPRLKRLGSNETPARPVRTPPSSGRPAPVAPPTGSEAARQPLVDAPPPPERRVVVTLDGPAGGLRGAVKPVVGGPARPLAHDEHGRARLELTLVGGEREIAFGAAGHRWVRREAPLLADGERIVLPEAAAPLVVKVREPDGAPAAGVPIDLRPASPLGPRRTDAGGTVVFDDLAPGLVVVLVGGLERAAPPLRLLAGVDRDARVVLEPPWTVAGRAVGADGAPLASVRVEAFEARGASGVPVTTDANGRFAWRGPVAGVLAVRFSTAGLASVSVEASPPATGPLLTDLGDVRLAEPGVEVRGRVRGGVGRAGAFVVAEPHVAALLREIFGPESVLDQPRVATLSADGSYVFEGLPNGIPLRLSLRGAGVPEDALLRPRPGEHVTQDFAPAAGETLRAVVRDAATGGPAAGLLVLVSSEPVDGDLELPGDRRVVTDAGGRVALEGLLPGAHFVRAYATGRRSLLRKIELPAAGDTELTLEPALTDASRRVSGVVLDEVGQPLAGLTVRAAGIVGISGPDGAFTLDGVESLAPTVTLVCGVEPGAEPLGATDLRQFSEPVRVEVTPGGPPVKVHVPRDQTLTLRAADALMDAPMAFLHVVARADDGRVLVDRGFALADGRLTLAGLPRVGLRLSLFAPGRRHVRVLPGQDVSSGSAAHAERDLGEVRLLRGLVIDGIVSDVKGLPIADARVAAIDGGWLGGLRKDPAPRRELALRTTRSGPDGAFRLEGLDPVRPATVVVWAPGFAPTLRRAVFALPALPRDAGTPPPDGAGDAAPPATAPAADPGPSAAERALARLEAHVDVHLRLGSHVSLLLQDEVTRQPVHGAIVDLESARNGSDFLDLLHRGLTGGQAGTTEEWRAISESLLWEEREPGAYSVGPIEPGEYELLVEHPLYHPERRKIPVLDRSDPFSFESLEVDPGARLDPSDPALADKVRRGPEMVRIYGSNKMRLPVDLRPR